MIAKNANFNLFIILIAVLSLWIRISYFRETVVPDPLNGDAWVYVQYAKNIVYHHTFSKSTGTTLPKPDSFCAPGYPAFIAACIVVAKMLGIKAYKMIMYAQIALGVLLSVITLFLGKLFLSKPWAILAAILVSFSPHLVSVGGYLLTETLFSFLLLFAIYSFLIAFTEKKSWPLAVSGGLFGLAYLVKPVVFFTPILFVLIAWYILAHSENKMSRPFIPKLLICLLAFFLITGAWSLRNIISVNSRQPSASDRLFMNLVIGSHSNYYDIWRSNPRDPKNPATIDLNTLKGSYPALTKLLLKRALKDPEHYAKWYLIDKPILLWSWNILVGQGDIYIFPVMRSLYETSKIAFATYSIMKSIHYFLFGFAVLGLFFLIKSTDSNDSDVPKFLYIVLIYISAVYVVTQSEPRYSIPLRPELYLCTVFFISKIFDYMKFAKGPREQAVEA